MSNLKLVVFHSFFAFTQMNEPFNQNVGKNFSDYRLAIENLLSIHKKGKMAKTRSHALYEWLLYSYILCSLYSTIQMIEIQTYCDQQPIQWLGKEGQHLLACFACSIQRNLELHVERQLLHSLTTLYSVEPGPASCKLLHACSIPI